MYIVYVRRRTFLFPCTLYMHIIYCCVMHAFMYSTCTVHVCTVSVSCGGLAAYQKILSWSPLLELGGVRMGEGGEGEGGKMVSHGEEYVCH